MSDTPYPTCIAFAGSTCIATGALRDVAVSVKRAVDEGCADFVLVFDASSSQPIELDLRGSVEDVACRIDAAAAETPAPGPRSPGRPKLGVVAREVTLLPRHWEWLSSQRGGASATLRRLVDEARRASDLPQRQRAAQDATYRFTVALAGNEPGFEDASRALYAGDRERFDTATEQWPTDVRDHARDLAAVAFDCVEGRA